LFITTLSEIAILVERDPTEMSPPPPPSLKCEKFVSSYCISAFLSGKDFDEKPNIDIYVF
jgi:hypothetical protein